jgi:hypothetical protein
MTLDDYIENMSSIDPCGASNFLQDKSKLIFSIYFSSGGVFGPFFAKE